MVPSAWEVSGRRIPVDSPVVMGILNLTPDSFSDGGELHDLDSALRRGERMVEEGAHILDVGGESTRPGAVPVKDSEELRRVAPVVEALTRRLDVPISVDTRKATVAQAALEAGAVIVNDVSGLSFDPGMGQVVAAGGAGVVLMHMRGVPSDMQERTHYADVVGEVVRELGDAVDRANRAGIARSAIVVDPGFGFAKTPAQSFALLGRLDRLRELGFPVLVGLSRKSFLGEVTGAPPPDRAVATSAACVIAYLGGARIFRVHDVAPVVQALSVAAAVEGEGAVSDESIQVR